MVAVGAGLCIMLGAGGVYAFRGTKAETASQGLVLAQALMEVRGEMCGGRTLKGTGVRMEVFASGDLNAEPLQTGLVPVLDMNVTPSTPAEAGQTVRWSGWLKAPEAGPHRFHLPAGVAGTLTLSRAVVLDGAAAAPDSTAVVFDKERLYPFTLVVTVDKAAADAGTWLLSWSQDSEQPKPITRLYLFPPTNIVAPPVKVASK